MDGFSCFVSPLKLSSSSRSETSNSTSTTKETTRSKRWETNFQLLIQYKEREGHVNVPNAHKEDGGNLGWWLQNQRHLYKNGKLKTDRLNELESIGIVWDYRTESEDRWEDMYQRLVKYKEQDGHTEVPYNYKDEDGKNLGTWVNQQRQSKKQGDLDRDSIDRIEALGFTWEITSSNWERMFSFLKEYKHERGDSNVPRNYMVVLVNGKEISLGSWVDRLRNSKKKGTLAEHRIRKLDGIGFEWDRDSSRWNRMFALLSDYKEREGHCNPPKGYKTSASTGSESLGTWLGTQRRAKKNNTLQESRKHRLEDLGVEWDPCLADWKEMFDLLVIYEKREGHCRVPWNHKEKGKNLGSWMNNIRVRKKNGNLGTAQSRALEDLGAVWDVRADKWDKMMTLLEQYKERNGHCRVPQKHKEGGGNLGTWLSTQRRLKREGTLHPSKKDQLEDVGVVWELNKRKWDEMLALLIEYQKREGDCLVPQDYKEDGKHLGTWIDIQRQSKKKGELGATKKDRLEAIGMVWDVSAFNRKEMMTGLLRYKEREGNCNVPTSHIEDGKDLGSWLNRQRQARAAGKLNPSFIKDLEATGVIWSTNEHKWESMFALLEEFQKREGHCRVPQDHKEGKDNKNLGTWLDYQRYKKKSEKLSATQQTRLENIGVKWNIYTKFDDDDDDWGFAGMDHLFDDEDMYS